MAHTSSATERMRKTTTPSNKNNVTNWPCVADPYIGGGTLTAWVTPVVSVNLQVNDPSKFQKASSTCSDHDVSSKHIFSNRFSAGRDYLQSPHREYSSKTELPFQRHVEFCDGCNW